MLAKLSQSGDQWGVLNFKKPHYQPGKFTTGAILACDGEVELIGAKPTEVVELLFTDEELSQGT